MLDGILGQLGISASGLSAQRARMDAIANNIANANTTRTPEGGPYRRQRVVVREVRDPATGEPLGVKVAGMERDQTPPRRVYDPGHPDADESGYVELPNVNVIAEMIDMLSATRAYEANATAIDAAKEMANRALDIGRF